MRKEKLFRFHKIFTVGMILLLLTIVAVSFMLGTTRADTENQEIPINKNTQYIKNEQVNVLGIGSGNSSPYMIGDFIINGALGKEYYVNETSIEFFHTSADYRYPFFYRFNHFSPPSALPWNYSVGRVSKYEFSIEETAKEGILYCEIGATEKPTSPTDPDSVRNKEYIIRAEEGTVTAGFKILIQRVESFTEITGQTNPISIRLGRVDDGYAGDPTRQPTFSWTITKDGLSVFSGIDIQPDMDEIYKLLPGEYTVTTTAKEFFPEKYSKNIDGKGDSVSHTSSATFTVTVGNVIVEHRDADTNEIIPSITTETIKGTFKSDNYTTAPADVPGYTLVANPVNKTGVFTDVDQTVAYVYKEFTPVIIDPISLNINKPLEKIYHGITIPNTDTVKVEIKIPKAVFDDEANAFLRDELTEAKYVIIPYDPTNANFNASVPTRAQFQAAYTAAEDGQRGSFLDPNQTIVSGDVDQVLEYLVDVTDNCKVWVMIEEVAPTRTEDYFAVYTADNFYTPTQVYHKGLNVDTADPNQLVYDALSVGYEDVNNDGVPDSYYGIPLDVHGNVIVAPSLGYDSVNVKALDSLPTSPIDLNNYWIWSEKTPDDATQEESLTLILDHSYVDTHPNFADRTQSAENTHIFYYEKNTYNWMDVHYFAYIMPGKYSFYPGEFVMTPNPESVMPDIELVRTPPVIDGYIAYAYIIDWGGAEVESVGGAATFTPRSNYDETVVQFFYIEEQKTLNVRQVLIDADEMIKPLSGYMTLYHLDEQTAEIKTTIEIATTTGMIDIPYSKYMFPLSRFFSPDTQLKISDIVPQYYTYVGYTLSYTTGNHNADARVPGDPVVDFSTNRDAWVTLYITPTSKTLDFFNWYTAINDFGTIGKRIPI